MEPPSDKVCLVLFVSTLVIWSPAFTAPLFCCHAGLLLVYNSCSELAMSWLQMSAESRITLLFSFRHVENKRHVISESKQFSLAFFYPKMLQSPSLSECRRNSFGICRLLQRIVPLALMPFMNTSSANVTDVKALSMVTTLREPK